MTPKTISKEDQKWQAESDADTMARYQEILGDKPRMNRAIKAAQERAKDLTQRANLMQTASKMKSPAVRKTASRKK